MWNESLGAQESRVSEGDRSQVLCPIMANYGANRRAKSSIFLEVNTDCESPLKPPQNSTNSHQQALLLALTESS